jgi:hypothetical protein
MRKGPPLEPLYYFEAPTGQTSIDRLYANDKVRAEDRALGATELASNGTGVSEPPTQAYTGVARMNF